MVQLIIQNCLDKHNKLIFKIFGLLLNSRCQVGCFPWKFVDGESSIARIVAFVEDDRYEKLMAKKARCELTKFGDIDGSKNAWLH